MNMDMNSYHNKVFGPLDKTACIYFYFYTAFFFVTLMLTTISSIYYLIKSPSKASLREIGFSIVMIFNIFLAYFVNRLMYTMCERSLA